MPEHAAQQVTDQLSSLQSLAARISTQASVLNTLCGQIAGRVVTCAPERLENEIKLHLRSIRDDVLEAIGTD